MNNKVKEDKKLKKPIMIFGISLEFALILVFFYVASLVAYSLDDKMMTPSSIDWNEPTKKEKSNKEKQKGIDYDGQSR